MTHSQTTFPSEKWRESLGWVPTGFVGLWTVERSRAIRLQRDKGDSVALMFDDSLEKLRRVLLKATTRHDREATFSMLGSLPRSSLQIWNDKLASLGNLLDSAKIKSLTTLLYRILARELTSREKASRLFWNSACNELSATLPSPIEIDSRGSGSILSNSSSQRQEVQSRSLTITRTSLPNRNLQKTCSALSTSIAANRWGKDPTSKEEPPATPHKTLVLNFLPTPEQKVLLDKNLRCSNYAYNKAVAAINGYRKSSGKVPSAMTLRNELVTLETRKNIPIFARLVKQKKLLSEEVKSLIKTKSLKNVVTAYMIKTKQLDVLTLRLQTLKKAIPPIRQNLKPWEVATHKEIRQEAVFEAKKNYDTCMTNIRAGRIRFFNLKFRTRAKQVMRITKTMLKLEDGKLRLTDKSLPASGKTIVMSNRSLKKLRCVSEVLNSTITKVNGVYKIHLPVIYQLADTAVPSESLRVCGVDPGVKTFLSVYGISGGEAHTVKLQHGDTIWRIDRLRNTLKKMRRDGQRKRLKRSLMVKLDRRQSNVTTDLHWRCVTYLTQNYDLIFLEKFGSHKLVKGSSNKGLNRNTMNLKPFQFREKLMYKSLSLGKHLVVVDSHHTTRTCSDCGNAQDMSLCDRTYNCGTCHSVLDRDLNAAKNMMLKGLCC